MASNEEVISTLNDLIETCRDGQEGFRSAAEGTADAELRALFLDHSRRRGSFAGELQTEVRRIGGEPETEGSVVAAIHRGWMDIKAAVTGADDRSILAECERGEAAALANYRAALGKDMPAGVRATVERQFAEVKDAHDRISSLARARGAGA